jgi:hypothetical protein
MCVWSCLGWCTSITNVIGVLIYNTILSYICIEYYNWFTHHSLAWVASISCINSCSSAYWSILSIYRVSISACSVISYILMLMLSVYCSWITSSSSYNIAFSVCITSRLDCRSSVFARYYWCSLRILSYCY